MTAANTSALVDQTAEALDAIRRAETATGTRPKVEATKPRTSTRKSTGGRSTAPAKKASEKGTQTRKRTPGKAVVKATSKAPAKVEKVHAKPKRAVADKATRVELAKRLEAARQAGFTRPQLGELSGLDTYPIWRAQDAERNAYADSVDALTALLDKIDGGEVAAPVRRVARSMSAQAAELVKQVEAVRSLLDAVMQRPRVSAAEKKLASSVLDALGGEDK